MSLWDVLATHKVEDSLSLHRRAASLPVTPAFVDARRRKNRNDLTTKGVFPHVYSSANGSDGGGDAAAEQKELPNLRIMSAILETVNNNNGGQATVRRSIHIDDDVAQKDEAGDIIVRLRSTLDLVYTSVSLLLSNLHHH